jgi:hypothetical protein
MLKDREACEFYVRRFQRKFPQGIRVTQANALAVATQFDWDWAVHHLIPGDLCENTRAFMKLTNDAYDAYRAVMWGAPSDATWRRAEREYERARAVAFARLVQNPALRRELGAMESVSSSWQTRYAWSTGSAS